MAVIRSTDEEATLALEGQRAKDDLRELGGHTAALPQALIVGLSRCLITLDERFTLMRLSNRPDRPWGS